MSSFSLKTGGLLRLVGAVRREPGRRLARDRDCILRYVDERISSEDSEWCSFMASHPMWQDMLARWRKKAGLAQKRSTT
jgi:hypothetical protein